jgi:hypothetical protein
LLRGVFKPLLGDDKLADVDGMEELDCARQFLRHQMRAVLGVVRHFASQLFHYLKTRKRKEMKYTYM